MVVLFHICILICPSKNIALIISSLLIPSKIMRFLNIALAVTALVLVLSVQPHSAGRVLDGEKEEWIKIRFVPLQSLSSGPVPPSGSSSCSHIPEKGAPPCHNGMKFAGHAKPPPPFVMATGQ